jgi:predicted DNA-binding transcriptional regulator AlpA
MPAIETRAPRRFMRRKHVEAALDISRNTLAAIIKSDPEFPRFVALSPGIEVIERADFERWLQRKKAEGVCNVVQL